jgi:hypothetical protein
VDEAVAVVGLAGLQPGPHGGEGIVTWQCFRLWCATRLLRRRTRWLPLPL